MWTDGERTYQENGTASARALRQECVLDIGGIARRPVVEGRKRGRYSIGGLDYIEP
jgi:hypothetical protein